MFLETRIRGSGIKESVQTSRLEVYEFSELSKYMEIPDFRIRGLLHKTSFEEDELDEVLKEVQMEEATTLVLANKQSGELNGVVSGKRVNYSKESAFRISIFAVKHDSVSLASARELLEKLEKTVIERYDNCTGIVMIAKTSNLGDMRLIQSMPWSENAVPTRDDRNGMYIVYDPIDLQKQSK